MGDAAPRRYLLSGDIEIRPLIESEARALFPGDAGAASPQGAEGRLLLTDRLHQSHRFVLNPVIARYLELYRHPLTPRQAAERLAAEAGCDVAAILPTTSAFFKRMRSFGVLRPADSSGAGRSEPMALDVGQWLDVYQITERLEVKSDVTLCRARAAVGGARVVLKVLTSPHRRARHVREEFRREFALMRSVDPHPGVCRCLAFVDDGQCMFAVLDDIDGRPLRRLFAGPGTPLRERLRVCDESLDVMAHLHARGMLHGDVHARNFLRDAAGRVRLIDFGLSCTIEEGGPDGDATHGGIPLYMPPERIRHGSLDVSERPGDLRSEVYQLGVVCYEVLAGTPPFSDAATWSQLVRAIQTSVPPPLVLTPDGDPIPSAAACVVARALAKAPDERFASAVEMRDAMREAMREAMPGASPGATYFESNQCDFASPR